MSQINSGKRKAPHADRDIHEVCYKKLNETEFKCKICIKEKIVKKGSGYTNTASHILRMHHDTYSEFMAKEKTLPLSFMAPKQMAALQWIDMIVSLNLPFNTVEKGKARFYCTPKPISIKTMRKYLSMLTVAIEKKISIALPDQFGLIFDGWSSGSAHFVALFAAIPCGKNYLLAFSTLPEETNQNADNHLEFIQITLNIYGKDLSNILFLVGDNCATNRSLASKANKPLIGCASHRLNLAADKLISDKETIIYKV